MHNIENNKEFIEQRRKGRMTFIFIALLFFGPFVLAALAFRLNWVPNSDQVNRGALVQSERPLSEKAYSVDGRDEQVTFREFWTIAIFVPDACTDTCKQLVDQVEIVHFRLNRDIERAQLVLVNDQNTSTSPFARKISSGLDTDQTIASFKDLKLETSGVYMIDPRGFPVSHYALDSDPKDLQKDLKRLLKYSRIG